MKRVLAFSLLLGLGIAVGCGAKVIVDEPLGAGGNGGAGGFGSSSSTYGVGGTVFDATVGPGQVTTVGPGQVTSVGPGPGPGSGPTTVTSVGTGPSMCDGQGDCGTCLNCGITSICSDLWNQCQTFQPCLDLLNCLNGCMDQPCNDKCTMTFPDGIDLYNSTAICLICNACFSDCNGSQQNCP